MTRSQAFSMTLTGRSRMCLRRTHCWTVVVDAGIQLRPAEGAVAVHPPVDVRAAGREETMNRKMAHSPAAGGFCRKASDGKADMPDGHTAKTADELLMEARALLPHRPSPAEALGAQARGALLIDIRGDDQRRADGLIPGAILVPRNALEWRCDLASRWRHPALTRWDQHLILICQEGFQSSLAAATLQRLGLINVTDLDGGFAAWAAAGLPLTRSSPGDLRGGSFTWVPSASRMGPGVRHDLETT